MMRTTLLPEEAVKRPPFRLHAPRGDGHECTLHRLHVVHPHSTDFTRRCKSTLTADWELQYTAKLDRNRQTVDRQTD